MCHSKCVCTHVCTSFREWWWESNPPPGIGFTLQNRVFHACQNGLAADWQRSECQSSECLDSDLQLIQELHHLHLTWPHLPAEFRREILNSISAALELS